ncbi:3-oxoacyl-ACP synthase [Hyalangium gracile]|uniref:3-oxoacyl-ACP synthase n=1 Tax=Hyalangium gracile TaxID=394092 RepID=UPI001CCA4083|nr:3-oxoacyl-ACP synthase [Hyalangium gracile]
MSRTDRMIALGREALLEVTGFFSEEGMKPVPLYLGLPEAGVGAAVKRDELIKALLAVARGRLELAGMYEGGRAGFFEALVAAQTDLRTGRSGPVALVGAVDSLCDGMSLRALAAKQLHLGALNPDGRIPGEAAGFVLVARPAAARTSSREALGVLLATALGEESRPFARAVPSMAEGLTQVFRQLRGAPAMGSQRVDSVLACQPGESFWSTEFSRAYLRNAALMPEPLRFQVAGEGLGDCGGGAGPVMLGAALFPSARQQREASRALLYGSADGGRIGACVVGTSPVS